MATRALLAVALGLAGALSACGPSREEQRMDEVRRICEGLVPGANTLQQASVALGGGQVVPATSCGSYLDRWGASDVCRYEEAICVLDFAFQLGDPGACEPTPGGPACWYGCGLRASDADRTTNGWGATLCARLFYGPQITPLIP